ncbi:MAG: hypothetical protein DWQ01_15290 [Planctomycetota bacterium]|nr:MAG: hypothetical protein DWQ01_15290 [Planctomycetota bacterium]
MRKAVLLAILVLAGPVLAQTGSRAWKGWLGSSTGPSGMQDVKPLSRPFHFHLGAWSSPEGPVNWPMRPGALSSSPSQELEQEWRAASLLAVSSACAPADVAPVLSVQPLGGGLDKKAMSLRSQRL